ncbi:hypothetical protein ACFY4B_27135 [Kitasatospora sp. NPDC001261]|uniref:hypothetical protein n=1 Tax=Kitasatospora sp. NPDC001261 TaxID=3364012 RepID=UPI0036CD987D
MTNHQEPPGVEAEAEPELGRTADPVAEPSISEPEAAAKATMRTRARCWWNGLGPRGKALVIGGGLAVLGIAAAAAAHQREHSAAGEGVTSPGPLADLIQAGVERLNDCRPAEAQLDSEQHLADPGAQRQYVMEQWDVGGYMRDTCLDPRRHPGECRHEPRPVSGSTRSRHPDLLNPDG